MKLKITICLIILMVVSVAGCGKEYPVTRAEADNLTSRIDYIEMQYKMMNNDLDVVVDYSTNTSNKVYNALQSYHNELQATKDSFGYCFTSIQEIQGKLSIIGSLDNIKLIETTLIEINEKLSELEKRITDLED